VGNNGVLCMCLTPPHAYWALNYIGCGLTLYLVLIYFVCIWFNHFSPLKLQWTISLCESMSRLSPFHSLCVFPTWSDLIFHLPRHCLPHSPLVCFFHCRCTYSFGSWDCHHVIYNSLRSWCSDGIIWSMDFCESLSGSDSFSDPFNTLNWNENKKMNS